VGIADGRSGDVRGPSAGVVAEQIAASGAGPASSGADDERLGAGGLGAAIRAAIRLALSAGTRPGRRYQSPTGGQFAPPGGRAGTLGGATWGILVRLPVGVNAALQVRRTAAADATAIDLTPSPRYLDRRMHSLARAT
jgi:hypothetical protein